MKRKILFRLEQDEDGYPPQNCETLWATQSGPGLYLVDNIPFFARGISCGDLILASEGELPEFQRVVAGGGHSTLRVIVYDEKDVPRIRTNLREFGCDSELSHVPVLVAVDIPKNVDFSGVLKFLDSEAAADRLEYEEAAIQHS